MKKSINLRILKITTIIFAVLLISTCIACSQNPQNSSQITVGFNKHINTSYNDSENPSGMKHYDGYTLQQATVVSRHNLRSPITEPGDPLHNKTNLSFIDFSSSPGELTLQGGKNENIMGQYFRKYYESENLLPQNQMLTGDSIYFLANSNQRTIATAKNFASGFSPVADTKINYLEPFGSSNPLFYHGVTKTSQEYKDQVMKEILELNGVNGLDDIKNKLQPQITKLESLIDFKNSKYAKENNANSVADEKLEINLEAGVGPKIGGWLRDVNIIIDGLKMQYYDSEDDSKALSGKNISYADWEDICTIDDVYQTTYCGTYTLGVDKSNYMLKEINQDINNQNRKFTFLCGHDNTIIALLAALKVKPYKLSNTIDHIAPIACKFVINKYKNANGEEFCNPCLVYATVDQVRHCYDLDMDNSPMCYELEFEGLQKNPDGLYKLSDFQGRIQESIAAYDKFQ